MTEVGFHVNVADKVGYACRLLRKAAAAGSKVVVTGDDAALRKLDSELWTFSDVDFVAHCHASAADAEVLAASPVVLADSARQAPHQQVLVNLGTAVPEGFERFDRLIELVAQDEQDLQHGRVRWRHYADRGYALKKIDQSGWEPR
jgi:DNA polymerase-3 subunit chi